jgi:hypothetical protein
MRLERRRDEHLGSLCQSPVYHGFRGLPLFSIHIMISCPQPTVCRLAEEPLFESDMYMPFHGRAVGEGRVCNTSAPASEACTCFVDIFSTCVPITLPIGKRAFV